MAGIRGRGVVVRRAMRYNFEYSFAGQLTTAEVRNVINTASIYALPARYEPFGLSILEAALSGCALVLGDIMQSARTLE